MPATKSTKARRGLPKQFSRLAAEMTPRAISDDAAYAKTVNRIDDLMAAGKLSRGQEVYLETLVQLVQAYEAKHHAIDTTGITGLGLLKHLLDENGMTASDLAALLGVHTSMGSKILKGERSLTIEHIRKLSLRFSMNPAVFLDT